MKLQKLLIKIKIYNLLNDTKNVIIFKIEIILNGKLY